MRRPLIAGNWKMNLDRARGVALVKELAGTGKDGQAEVAVCPPSVYLEAVCAAAKGTQVKVGAQNMYFEKEGAFTGEVSGAMLKDIGCEYVILGHSERRTIFDESDEEVSKKTAAAFAAGLTPIVCVGELLAEREAGKTADVIRRQFTGSFAGVSEDQMRKLVIAYEPVWAIGTGKVASPQQAEEVHADLRKLIAERYNPGVSEVVRILYGGSVKAANAGELLGQPNIDGALVGGASLTSKEFLGILQACPSA